MNWTATDPFQVVDDSTTDVEWLRAGLPPLDRNWSSSDLTDVARRLEESSQSSPSHLPRDKSSRSGKTFARIVNRDNLGVLSDTAVPIAIRLPAAAEYSAALGRILRLYTNALSEKQISGREVVELYGAQLYTSRIVLARLDEFLATFSKDDPTYEKRMAALEKLRDGLRDILLSSLSILSEPRYYGLPARQHMVKYCIETFPGIVPQLNVSSRQGLLENLSAISADPRLGQLQPELDTLRDEVARVVAKATK